jgi:hypothetical protein
MSDIDLAITRSRRLEQMLEKHFGARGRGLHEKTGSVEARLPPELVRKLRLVATVRNKVVHEESSISDRDRFIEAADSAERELKALCRGNGGRSHGCIWSVAIAIVLIILAGLGWMLWRQFHLP